MNPERNPLQKFFRKPVLDITLPSRGSQWPKDHVEFTESMELEVFPMTAMDSFAYHAPGGLLNGEILVPAIENCIPGIKNAWSIPSCDFLSVLLAMYVATYGQQVTIESSCVECQNTNNLDIDLALLLKDHPDPEYKSLEFAEYTVYFKPLSYQLISQNGTIELQQQKTLLAFSNPELSEEIKTEYLNRLLQSIMNSVMSVMTQSISKIVYENHTVDNQQHISEFVKKCDREVFISIKDHIFEYKKTTENRSIDAICKQCQCQYQHQFDIDQIRFVNDVNDLQSIGKKI